MSFSAPYALADSIFVGSLERKGVVIREVKGNVLSFEINSRTSEVPADKVTKLVIDGDPPLTAAEQAYADGKWNDAVDGYQKVIRTGSKPWMKDWAALRLLDAASKSGRFDAVASAYILMLQKDPATAASMKPAMPDSKSTFLETAVNDVNTALRDPKLTTEQKRALLGFLIELQTARSNQAGMDSAYEQLAKLPGADVNDPAAKKVVARRHLLAASAALTARNYPQVLKEIDADHSVYVDPAQQADALYLIAEAREGLAASSGDPNQWKDVALAYMRVVALAKNDPQRPHVGDSLLKTAAILQKVGDPQSATQVYKQILAQYPSDPAAPAAKAALDKLAGN